jgi:type II secretory pathway component PulF
MTSPTDDGALARIRVFWRRALVGPPIGARIEIYEELAPTLAAGIGVREALRAVVDRHRGAKRRAAECLAHSVERDVPLSETMRANPDTFTAIEAALVATGERTGRLDVAFRGAAAQLERRRSTANRLIQVCVYPLILVHVMLVIMPLGIIAAARGFGAYLAFVVPALLVCWGALFVAASVHAALAAHPAYARFVERIPVVGRVTRAAALARFARSFAALHGAGVSHDEALGVAAEASGNAELEAETAAAIRSLREGRPLPVALDHLGMLESDVRGLLLAGEQSGELESAARRVADLEDERFDVVLNRAVAVLPSILIGLIAIVVAVLAFKVIGGYYKSILDLAR